MAALVAGVVSLGMAGCKSPPPPPMEEGSGSGTGSEFDDGSSGMDSTSMKASPDSLKAIYFDYDRFEIRDDAKPTLKANAEVITSNDGWGRVTIEGHCDERGSAEYNLAHGERRANKVRRYELRRGESRGLGPRRGGLALQSPLRFQRQQSLTGIPSEREPGSFPPVPARLTFPPHG
jgi:hypothetical protein